jgi:hypothetical protein
MIFAALCASPGRELKDFAMVTFSGTDPASRAWRREQMELSNDIEGLPRDPHADAMIAGLDALDLTDEQRIAAMKSYFIALAEAQRVRAA